jgi:hypothetical protein
MTINMGGLALETWEVRMRGEVSVHEVWAVRDVHQVHPSHFSAER